MGRPVNSVAELQLLGKLQVGLLLVEGGGLGALLVLLLHVLLKKLLVLFGFDQIDDAGLVCRHVDPLLTLDLGDVLLELLLVLIGLFVELNGADKLDHSLLELDQGL